MDIKYITSNGHERTIKDVKLVSISDNKSYATYEASNGKTYHWFCSTTHNGKVLEEVMTVSTPRNWCRFLGDNAKTVN